MQENNLKYKSHKIALPRVPFVELKEEILGTDYELSVSFVELAQMKKLAMNTKVIQRI